MARKRLPAIKHSRSSVEIQTYAPGDPGIGRQRRTQFAGRGRPSNAFREACRAALARSKAILVLERIVSGDILEPLGVNKAGEVLYGPTKNADRLRAVELLSRIAYSLPNTKDAPEGDDERHFVFLVHPVAETTEEWLRMFKLHAP